MELITCVLVLKKYNNQTGTHYFTQLLFSPYAVAPSIFFFFYIVVHHQRRLNAASLCEPNPSRQHDLWPLTARTICRDICRREGWRALATASSSFFSLPFPHRNWFERTGVTSKWGPLFLSASGPPRPCSQPQLRWHVALLREVAGGDPLIYYSLSAGAARATRTVSCVLIRAHPIRVRT